MKISQCWCILHIICVINVHCPWLNKWKLNETKDKRFTHEQWHLLSSVFLTKTRVFLTYSGPIWVHPDQTALLFMHLADEVDEAFPWFWHSLFWPVCELELPDGPWLSVLKAERERRMRIKELAAALWHVTPSHYIHIYRRRACQTDDEYMTHPKRVWEAQETTIIKKRHVDTELMPQCQRDILLFKSLGFISNKSMLLFIKDALNWRKATVNTSIMLIQINAVLLSFLFICASWKIKCIAVSTEILGGTTVFNIDNNQKYFLSSKSSY